MSVMRCLLRLIRPPDRRYKTRTLSTSSRRIHITQIFRLHLRRLIQHRHCSQCLPLGPLLIACVSLVSGLQIWQMR